ncbi:hypothetical protein N9B94_00935 [Verrucomicrobia bacterium]|nr:hypothetical protein [Verrucomicrobiota bacterium]
MSSTEDNPLIASLLEKADDDDVDAQYELGWRHALGAECDPDEEVSVHWLKIAADNDHMLAQNNLGARYVSGEGVETNLIEAYILFFRAASQGDRKAGKNCDSVAKQLSPEDLATARTRAGKLL